MWIESNDDYYGTSFHPKERNIEPKVVAHCSGFKQIAIPDKAYQYRTSRIGINDISELETVNSINDGTQTVSFSTPLEKRKVPDTWSVWSSSPASENATPPILFTQAAKTLSIFLSVPARIFGFELQPDQNLPLTYKVEFLSEGKILGSITKNVSGSGNAQLFAAEIDCTCPAVDEVVITGPDNFAITQVRYLIYDCDDDSYACCYSEMEGRPVTLKPPGCFNAGNFDVDFCFCGLHANCRTCTVMGEVTVCGNTCLSEINIKKITITGSATVVIFRNLTGGCIGDGKIGEAQEICFNLECVACEDFNCKDFRKALMANPCHFLTVSLIPVIGKPNTVKPVVAINCDEVRAVG